MAFLRPSLMAGAVRHPRMPSNRRSSTYALALTILLMMLVALLMFLALGIFSLPAHSDSDLEDIDIRHVRSIYETRTISAVDGLRKGGARRMEASNAVNRPWKRRARRTEVSSDGNGLGKRGPQWTEVISWQPRAFIYHNFLSKEECEYLIEQAKPHMMKSSVVDSTTGKSKDSRVRTSTGMFFQRGQDKIIQDIEKRIADYTFVPVENGEAIQVLHYEVGQKYEAHFDYFFDQLNIKNGGQRMATLLMYLSDVEEGGETVFPSVKVNNSSLPRYNELSECGKSGLSVKPKMGDALLFWSMKPDATLDPLSLHGACPVIKGNKWSATKWMHILEYKDS